MDVEQVELHEARARIVELEQGIRRHRERMADHPAVLEDVGGPDQDLWDLLGDS